jgi:hypothetical protein
MQSIRSLILIITLVGVSAIPEGWVASFSEGVSNLASGKIESLAPFFVHDGRFCVNAVCGGKCLFYCGTYKWFYRGYH